MARRHLPPTRALAGVLAGGLAAGLLAGCTSDSPPSTAATVSSAPARPAPAGTDAPGPGPTGTAAPAPPGIPVRDATAPAPTPAPAPVRLAVPSQDIDMAVVPVGVEDDGSMQIPADADEAGWYRYGPAPGDDEGNALLAAHVDSRQTGIGPFAALRDVEVGAEVRVTTADGTTHEYRVTRVEKIAKDQAPLDLWFARTGPPLLRLVTCGGAWHADVGHYADNVVVTAEPTGG